MTNYNGIPNLYTDTITDANGQTLPLMVYLPSDYKIRQYPCFYFFNGRGEDTGGASKMAVWGPLAMISSSYQPPFIAMAVQAVGWDASQSTIYTTLKARYNFGKVVLTGISEGAWLATNVMAKYPNDPLAKDVVAFIPMSSQADATSYNQAVKPIIASGIPVMGFGDDPGDVHGIDTHNFIKALVTANPEGNYTFVNTPGTGHGGWNTNYATTSTQAGGTNVYNWALKFVSYTPPITTPPPTTTPPPVTTPTLVATVQVYSDGSIKKI